MPDADDALAALREALRLSPDNVPLQKVYADALIQAGRADEAEPVYRRVLAAEPDDLAAQLGLSDAFYRQQKTSAALVVLEELLQHARAPARAYVLYARVLLATGDHREAARQYGIALDLDPTVADEALLFAIDDAEADPPGGPQADEPAPRRVPLREEDYNEADDEDYGGRAERPAISFAEVGGMEALKEEIRLKIIYPMQHADLYRSYGKTLGGGILMYGPPGCGKTHLARATAGEVDAAFLSVGLHDVLNMWLGQSEHNLHHLFEEARDAAPCVLFFDEVDALGASRTDMRRSAGRNLINQFLAELDGTQGNNDGVLVLAATNAPWHLDNAFRRPGRFDRILFVPPPDLSARAEILQIHLRGKPTDDLNLERIAKKTADFSGADLKAVVDRCIEAKLQEAIRAGVPRPLTTRDLLQAAKGHRATASEWFITARNHAIYANEGGLYDDILLYLNRKKR